MYNALRHNSPPYTVFIQGRGLLGSCILGFDGTPPYKVQLLITFGVLDANENCCPQLLYLLKLLQSNYTPYTSYIFCNSSTPSRVLNCCIGFSACVASSVHTRFLPRFVNNGKHGQLHVTVSKMHYKIVVTLLCTT